MYNAEKKKDQWSEIYSERFVLQSVRTYAIAGCRIMDGWITCIFHRVQGREEE